MGGISSGMNIVFRVAVKPVSTIGRDQQTATFDGEDTVLRAKGRHDPCVLPRTPPLVEAMSSLVLADAVLIQKARVSRGEHSTIAFPVPVNFTHDKRPHESNHTDVNGKKSKIEH